MFSEGWLQRVIGVCPQMNENLRLVKKKFYRKVVRTIVLGNRPTIHVGEAHELFQRVVQQIHLGGLFNIFISEGCPRIKQIFLFGNDFHTWNKHMRGVGEDSRHGIGHDGIFMHDM